jgi:hypothetical protein
VVGNPIEVTGSYSIKPPHGLLGIIEYRPLLEQYWPKGYITIDEKTKTWVVDVNIGGKPDEKIELIVAAIGKNGRILLEYSRRVGPDMSSWRGVHALTTDIKRCASVTIKKRQNRPG